MKSRRQPGCTPRAAATRVGCSPTSVPDFDVSLVYCANLALVDRVLPDATIEFFGGPNAGGIIDPETSGIPGDFNGDGFVDGNDLAFLLGYWGLPQGDLDGDGITGGADLAILLGYWTS